jgi:hypothetical protein
MWFRWAALVALVLLPSGRSLNAMPSAGFVPSPPYAGWAVEAYPEMLAAEMEAAIQRMVDGGANVVWIGHNNPGLVDVTKVEPGLSYAVYEAYRDPLDPRHTDAMAIVEAQRRVLDACRQVGVPAVLPVGYQIQMGRVWNERHPADLRRDAAGQALDIYGGGVSASFYASSYRRDIEAYYRWLEAEFVRPYADVILMLNLADEPIGGDYSHHAEAVFRQVSGFGFDEVGDDPQRQRQLGAFQSRYVVDYAIYSASLWQEIHPGLPVTMSFDGAQARQTLTLPDVEALFRDTPDNFVVTFDAYPRDGLPDVPLSEGDMVGLFLLARSVGLYSARYDKPVWLWAAANRWGLSQDSADPGTVSDAVANGIYLALLVRQGGGDLQGIAYWNYNVKEQGLYNDVRDTAYDVETMFARVSATLPVLRELMVSPPARPEALVLAPPARSHESIGAQRASVILEVQPFQRLAILAKDNVNTAIVGSLAGWSLDGVRAIVALSPSAGHFTPDDLTALDEFMVQGGKVVTSPGVGTALVATRREAPELRYDGLVEQRGNLYLAQQGIAVLFEDRRHETLTPFWRDVLGLDVSQPGYRIVTDRYAFHYHIGAEPVTVWLDLPFVAFGPHYGPDGWPKRRVYGTLFVPTLGRREYVFLRRDWNAWPWVV